MRRSAMRPGRVDPHGVRPRGWECLHTLGLWLKADGLWGAPVGGAYGLLVHSTGPFDKSTVSCGWFRRPVSGTVRPEVATPIEMAYVASSWKALFGTGGVLAVARSSTKPALDTSTSLTEFSTVLDGGFMWGSGPILTTTISLLVIAVPTENVTGQRWKGITRRSGERETTYSSARRSQSKREPA